MMSSTTRSVLDALGAEEEEEKEEEEADAEEVEEEPPPPPPPPSTSKMPRESNPEPDSCARQTP